jgi:hypothetical protein
MISTLTEVKNDKRSVNGYRFNHINVGREYLPNSNRDDNYRRALSTRD